MQKNVYCAVRSNLKYGPGDKTQNSLINLKSKTKLNVIWRRNFLIRLFVFLHLKLVQKPYQRSRCSTCVNVLYGVWKRRTEIQSDFLQYKEMSTNDPNQLKRKRSCYFWTNQQPLAAGIFCMASFNSSSISLLAVNTQTFEHFPFLLFI